MTDIGDKLYPAAIERTLDNPTAPMPSYANLPAEKKEALVEFLSQLKGDRAEQRSVALDRRAAAPSRRGRCRRCSIASPAPYDLMNSVMTAGLHHRWRQRAADLARVGPGVEGARRRDRHRRPRDRARLARRGRGRLGLLRRDARRGARARRRACAGSTATRSTLPYEDGAFDAATVGFGARNFSDLERGLGEMARVVRPGGRVVVLEITTPAEAAAVDVLLAVVRPRRAAAGQAGGRAGGLHLPAELGQAVPGAGGARRGDGGRRARRRALDPDRGRDHRAALGDGGR